MSYGIVARQRICAAEGCNARCQPPHTKCSRHRPKPERKWPDRTSEQKRRRNALKQEQRRKARGVSAQWEDAW